MIMRKSYFAIIALGALVIASCQKENSAYLPKVDSPVFTATLDAGTKTALDETGKKSEWVKDDAILVMNEKGDTAKYTAQNSGATATFTTTTEGFKGTEFIAMYPATPAGSAWWNAADTTVNKLWLKPSQTAVDSGYDPEAHIAVAYSDTKTLDFLNAVSLLKFTCGSDKISEVCVYVTADASFGTGTESKNVLSGNFNFNTETKNVITASGNDITTNQYVKVTGALKKGQTYYIACLPTTFTEGFTVEVVSNNIKGDNKTTKKNYELKRNTILDLGNVEYKKTLYLKPNKNWNDANAWFAAYFFNDKGDNTWRTMEKVDDTGYYKVVAPDVNKYPNVIFCRMNPASKDLNWGNKWTQTENLNIGDNNCYTITDGEWEKGSWTGYSE